MAKEPFGLGALRDRQGMPAEAEDDAQGIDLTGPMLNVEQVGHVLSLAHCRISPLNQHSA